MREQKFRLLKDGKIVGYELHKDGFIYHQELNDKHEGYDILITKLERRNDIRNDIEHPFWIEHDDKEQYTGKLDKNKVEIYEGDKMNGITYKEPYAMKTKKEIIGVVMWYERTARFWLHVDLPKGFRTYPNMVECEVIGNIHEKKEGE